MSNKAKGLNVANASAVLLPTYAQRPPLTRIDGARQNTEAAYKQGYDDAVREHATMSPRTDNEAERLEKKIEEQVLEVATQFRREFLDAMNTLITAIAPSLACSEARQKLAELLDAGIRDVDALSIKISTVLIASDDVDYLPTSVNVDDALSPYAIEATWRGGGLLYKPEALIDNIIKTIDQLCIEERRNVG